MTKQLSIIILIVLMLATSSCKKSPTEASVESLPSLATGAVTNITDNSAVVAGDVSGSGGSTVNGRGVCYGTLQNPTISGTCAASGSGTGPFSVSLTSLTSSTTYFLRAYATNSLGTAYGAQISFTTSASPPVIDIDGNVYPTVQIGTQVWMAANLRTTRYRNAVTISNWTNDANWSGLTTGAWAHYDNNTSNDPVYGKLYNWYAVVDNRNICPTGWRVPSDEDWTVLSNFLATDDGFKMKATSGWANNGNGSNESGFSGLPGGNRNIGGPFNHVGTLGYFWSSTPYQLNTRNAWYRTLESNNRVLIRRDLEKGFGMSVRCVRN